MSDVELAIRTGCNAADVHLTCSYPECQCKQIPTAIKAALGSAAPQGGSGWIPGDRVLVERALRPFIHRDLSRIASGNIECGASPVFQRDDAVLTLGDFWRAQAAYNQLFPRPTAGSGP